jgi:Tfp pilus assembly protein PilF
MGDVDAESRSTVVLWERAKAFFDNGNYEQAVRGLRLVLEQKPSNAEAHHQAGVAYGHLGNLERSRHHLESAVRLDSELVDAKVQLATVYLEEGSPGAAIELLSAAIAQAPEDPDAGWLLGRAQIRAGDVAGGLASFERATARGDRVPAWAHNDWGSALAQSGRPDAALAHFRAALAENPEDPQALFYEGLVLEGLGRVEEAVGRYCRSLRVRPDAPAAARLRVLGRDCD